MLLKEGRIGTTIPAITVEREWFINDEYNFSITNKLEQNDEDSEEDSVISDISSFSDTSSSYNEMSSVMPSLLLSKTPVSNFNEAGVDEYNDDEEESLFDDKNNGKNNLPSFWGRPSVMTMKSSKYNLPTSLFSQYQKHRSNQKVSTHNAAAADMNATITVCSSFSASSSSISSSIIDDNSIIDNESKSTTTTSTTNEGNNFRLLGHRPKRKHLQKHKKKIHIGSVVGQSSMMLEIKSTSDDVSSVLSCDETANILAGDFFEDTADEDGTFDENSCCNSARSSLRSEKQQKQKARKKKLTGFVKSEMDYCWKTLKSPIEQLKMNRKVILHRSSKGYFT